MDPSVHTVLIIAPGQSDSACIPVLEAARYQVHTTSRSASLTPLLQRLAPDLVVLDANNADPATITVCEQIRHAEDANSYRPVILLRPAHANSDLLAEALGRVDGFLEHPLNGQQLLGQVQILLIARRHIAAVLKARSEQQIMMRKQVQTLNVIKNAIVRNVSHEMRTPVLQIKSAISLMDEQIDSDEPPDVATLHTLLDMATQATARLENTVANITQVAEIQNLKQEPFLITDSIELALRNVQRSLQSRDNYDRITTEHVAPDLPLALGDKRGVALALYQLLDNALKFSPNGGPVEIIVRPSDDHTLWIGVRDYGIGIPADKLERIFDEFYQVEAESTRRFGGVGIGLTLVTYILERLDSTIQVDSTPGAGSTFFFTLPLADLPLADLPLADLD